jgi:hypothetical protein
MATLEVTFTLALPVCATQLGAHLQAYLETLQTVNALRACNRFGQGSQCHIRKLPIEIVQSIAHYYTLPIREERLKRYKSCLKCYDDSCERANHRPSKEALLAGYHEMREMDAFECPSDPDDSDLEDFTDRMDEHEPDGHSSRRCEWAGKAQKMMKDRPLFRKHFGLDIWLSNVCMGTARREEDSADTTITYLVLPDRAAHSKVLSRHMGEDGYENAKSGYGMTVSMDHLATPTDVQKFGHAMKVLDLNVFIQQTQSQPKVLSLASAHNNHAPALLDNAAPVPRPMFLVRHEMEGE